MSDAPEGYNFAALFVSGSNVNHVELLLCKKCGSLVGAPYTHNAWHKKNATFNIDTMAFESG